MRIARCHKTLIHRVVRGRVWPHSPSPSHPSPTLPLLPSCIGGREGRGGGFRRAKGGVNGEVMMMGGWRPGRGKDPHERWSFSLSLSLSLSPSLPRHLRVSPRFSSRQRGARCERRGRWDNTRFCEAEVFLFIFLHHHFYVNDKQHCSYCVKGEQYVFYFFQNDMIIMFCNLVFSSKYKAGLKKNCCEWRRETKPIKTGEKLKWIETAG